ncbi:MAG: hypothetical protein LUE99_10805, partial [Bacteroides sp.]|nr:hypothetical protein [Bacteroides sp.]
NIVFTVHTRLKQTIPNIFGSNPTDSILNVLDSEISKGLLYINQKEKEINPLRDRLKQETPYSYSSYDLYKRIFDEYKSYQFDSAHVYALKEQHAAYKLANDSLLVMANCDLIFCYTSTGLFKEACDVVDPTRQSLDNVSPNIRGNSIFIAYGCTLI